MPTISSTIKKRGGGRGPNQDKEKEKEETRTIGIKKKTNVFIAMI